MDQIKSLLNLPIETLIILAAGYLGYKIAFTGKDQTHKSIDTIFISLAFGLIAKLTYSLIVEIPSQLSNEFLTLKASVFAVSAALVGASIWRKWGEDILQSLLRKGDISYSDSTRSAWDNIRVSTKYRPTQLVVRKTDGCQVMCDDLKQYEDFPHGPCIYGEDGSVALYVSFFRNSAANNWVECDPNEEGFGIAITYIPADQVAEIEIRHMT